MHNSTENYVDWENIKKILEQRGLGSGGSVQRLAILLGCLTREQTIKAIIPSGSKSNYNQEKYKFLLDADFYISNRCCNVMKKYPSHKYHKDTGRNPMTAQMASESRLRTQQWLKNGCNGFDLEIPTSNPMSFWTEQDILTYIYINKLPICSAYGEVITETESAGQLDLSQFGLFEQERPTLKTTGCNRTGCVLCGFGCHLEKEGEERFVNLKKTHPNLYGLLDVIKNNGVTYREAIDWINNNSDLNIKY